MSNLKEMASSYEPKNMYKNIVDLPQVPTDIEVHTINETYHEGTEKEETVELNYVEVDSQKYRVPKTVLAQLKVILEKKPDCKFVSVGKSGSGFNTEYTTVAM